MQPAWDEDGSSEKVSAVRHRPVLLQIATKRRLEKT